MYRRLLRFRKSECAIKLGLFAIFLILIILIILYIVSDHITSERCPLIHIQQKVAELCLHYERGKIDGNMCEDICDERGLKFRIVSCSKSHIGKYIVFEAVWQNDAVFIKAHRKPDAQDHVPAGSMSKILSLQIMQFLRWRGFSKDSLTNPSVILNKLWTGEFAVSKMAAEYTMLMLIDQTEYVLFKMFENSDLFPQVLGNCGYFYAVEKLLPLDSMYVPRIPANFKQRASLALHIVEYLQRIDEVFQNKLHFCDVKWSHLGVDERRRIKFLDADTVEFQASLENQFKYSLNVTCEEQCSLFDCVAKCENDKCLPKTINTNIQVFCNNIFKRGDITSGLLQNPPSIYRDELRRVLQDCINGDNTDIRTVYENLKQFLRKHII
ncbi:Uncharacterised protein g3225 [Pycnogonum litorale]